MQPEFGIALEPGGLYVGVYRFESARATREHEIKQLCFLVTMAVPNSPLIYVVHATKSH